MKTWSIFLHNTHIHEYLKLSYTKKTILHTQADHTNTHRKITFTQNKDEKVNKKEDITDWRTDKVIVEYMLIVDWTDSIVTKT